MVLSSMYKPWFIGRRALLGTLENNADSPREARKTWFSFFYSFSSSYFLTNPKQLFLATDGRSGVEPEVGGSSRGGSSSGDVRESTGNPCYLSKPSFVALHRLVRVVNCIPIKSVRYHRSYHEKHHEIYHNAR